MEATCVYDEERNIIDVLYDDGKQARILCGMIEDALDVGIIGESRMIWLKDNRPRRLCGNDADRPITGLPGYVHEELFQATKTAGRKDYAKNWQASLC